VVHALIVLRNMKKHFKRLRRLTVVSSTVAPFLVFLTFICVARDSPFLATIPALAAWLLFSIFPTKVTTRVIEAKPSYNCLWWFRLPISALMAIWLLKQPGVTDLISHLYSKEALWDWRIISAVFLACFKWGLGNYYDSNDLDDREILAIYDDQARDRITQKAEQAAPRNH
jgi:hypothetical protein